jgi:hypothetical protein
MNTDTLLQKALELGTDKPKSWRGSHVLPHATVLHFSAHCSYGRLSRVIEILERGLEQ